MFVVTVEVLLIMTALTGYYNFYDDDDRNKEFIGGG